MRLLAASAAAILAGCASSSGVMKVGPDTFTISASAVHAAGGSVGARASAYREADAHCRGMGREVLVTNDRTTRDAWNQGVSEVVFRCLAAGDPELRRPDYRPTPDVVIQDQRRP
jgi:hypothetical protein